MAYPAHFGGKTMLSLRELHDAYGDAVLARLRHSGIVGPTLEDLCQEVFIVAFRKATEMPQQAENARRWLIAVARKVAANWHRLRRHKYESSDMRAVASALAAPEDPEEDFAVRDLVRRAFGKLERDDAEILWRHVVEGVTLKELATWLGTSKSGAHLRLQIARERLRVQI